MICHFSCGAASAVALLLVLDQNPEPVYTDPFMEHPDNKRFLNDISKLINKPITILECKDYKHPFEVFEKKRFLASPAGAPCTTELKKKTAQKYLGSRLYEEDNVFGFDIGEQKRANKYINNNPLMPCRFPLIENGLDKSDCFYILDALGIDLPYMYKLGYKNSNCTGCVKAENFGYWAAIREDFPDIYQWYANFERRIGKKDESGKPRGASINKKYIQCPNCNDTSCGQCNKDNQIRLRVFLDELPDDTKPQRNISFTCGYSCGAQDMEVLAVEELTREPSIMGYLALQKIKELLP